MDDSQLSDDLTHVLFTKDQLQDRIVELAAEIDRDYAGKDLLLIGVLNGAVMVMADLSRALKIHCRMDWMAVSSYGSGTQSSGVVRILKDLSTDITGVDVLLVEDIIDTGLTLSYLVSNLLSRSPASLEIMTAFRKPEAARNTVKVAYVGFDIPNEFVVGYGLDYNGRYRNLTSVGTLSPAHLFLKIPRAIARIALSGLPRSHVSDVVTSFVRKQGADVIARSSRQSGAICRRSGF